jgi:4-carboxymuconolactone decarboxylase
MARIQPIDPAAADDKVREALEALPPLNIFRTLAHAETTFRPFLRFGGAVLTRMRLDPLVREVAILVVAREAEARYEWIQHEAIAKQVGATDAQIAALEARSDPHGAFDPAQAAAIEFAAAVTHSPRVGDELFAQVRAHFDDREIVELLLAIGDYLMLARVMTVLEIDLDDPAATGSIVGGV